MVIQRNLDCDFPPGNEHNIPPNGKRKNTREVTWKALDFACSMLGKN